MKNFDIIKKNINQRTKLSVQNVTRNRGGQAPLEVCSTYKEEPLLPPVQGIPERTGSDTDETSKGPRKMTLIRKPQKGRQFRDGDLSFSKAFTSVVDTTFFYIIPNCFLMKLTKDCCQVYRMETYVTGDLPGCQIVQKLCV